MRDGDVDADGLTIASENSKGLGEGTIKSATGDVNANHAYGYQYDIPGHEVDALAPAIELIEIASNPGDDDTYRADNWIAVRVTFSEDVDVTGDPQLTLDIGGEERTMEFGLDNLGGRKYAERPSNERVLFGYLVQEGDVDNDGISIGANALSLNGGTIQDMAGNDADLTYEAVGDDADHKVSAGDTIAPTVSSVAITSDPGEDANYESGDSIQVTVSFSEGVTVTGTPQLALDIGGDAKTADYESGDGDAVVFTYMVAVGDMDDDGIAIGANTLSLPSGVTIRDHDGNDADLTHDAVAADPDHRVDAVAPTVSTITITSDPGEDATYEAGDTIRVKVAFSEGVTVTGTPQLALDIGGDAKTADYESGDGDAVVFTYTVAVGDMDDDGIAIGANSIALNGGTIRDTAGNDATLTHDAVAADSGHTVFAPGGL